MVTTELRFYDGSVFIISGADVEQVVFYESDGSKDGCSIVIEDEDYYFQDGKITWNGSMEPFICWASLQSRISSLDVTFHKPDGVSAPSDSPSFRLIFDGQGRYLGHSVPPRRGVYLVRVGAQTQKVIVR
ncbi:MAG: hypothetical protein K6C30_07065 [Bacteroidaceae bacterium]|nr:hypothetical protein [Bacteroidaceae bacterium]